MVIFSRLEAANVDEINREQVAYFEGLGQDFEWKVYDYDRPSDLKDRLAAHGFIIEAYLDGQPASAGWTYFPQHSQFASLWGGSTIREHRNQGLYTALLAVRLQEAVSRQVSYLTVDASPMSQPILEKFGFERIAYSYPCKWKVK